jgi:2-dehydropantoate 2-reductase
MRICVYGAGSLGSAIGGMLAERHDVIFIGRAANVESIRENGLELRGAIERRVDVEAHPSIDGLPPPELMLITTKSYNTKAVIEACRGWVEEDTKVLTLQNGLGNLEALREWRASSAFGGTTTMGAALVSPGIVHVSSIGRTVIGADIDRASAASISSMFRRAGMSSSVATDIQGEIWAKAIVNASINPLTAVLGVTNGALLESRTVSKLMSEICLEGESVARASGVTLPVASVYRRARTIAQKTADNRSSMLRDVELGRKTEISSINGHIARVGAGFGVPTPLNWAMVAMVRSLESRPVEKG